jgi:hypothetical protein
MRVQRRGLVTVIRAGEPLLGLFVFVLGGLGAGYLLFPFYWGLRAGLAALALILFVGMGFGYRVVISPEGILVSSALYGVPLPFSSERMALETDVDDSEPDAIYLNYRDLSVPDRYRGALREALYAALQRAEAPSAKSPPH